MPALEADLWHKRDANHALETGNTNGIHKPLKSNGLSNGITKIYEKVKSSFSQKSKNENQQNGHCQSLTLPKIILYDPNHLTLNWAAKRKMGCGLSNLGNTCFLNSVLQCLTYTPSLTNYLLSGHHTKVSCNVSGFCALCGLQMHISKCLNHPGSMSMAIKPLEILQNLKYIAKNMTWGKQEDAHEFLRYLIEGLQRAALAKYPGASKRDKYSQQTTVIDQIFGGYTRSQVKCLNCHYISNTYEQLLDISLDLKGADSVERALFNFIQVEKLDIENAYCCDRCKKKVAAEKRLTVEKPPRVLTVHLKRFDMTRYIDQKISRHVTFPVQLNLSPYISEKNGTQVNYQLYAVLVHSGFSCSGGHYYCYVRSPNGPWYCMNDSSVTQTSLNTVLNSEAYMIFYTRNLIPSQSSRIIPATQTSGALNVHRPMIGPQLPPEMRATNGNGSLCVSSSKPAASTSKVQPKKSLVPYTNGTVSDEDSPEQSDPYRITSSEEETPKCMKERFNNTYGKHTRSFSNGHRNSTQTVKLNTKSLVPRVVLGLKSNNVDEKGKKNESNNKPCHNLNNNSAPESISEPSESKQCPQKENGDLKKTDSQISQNGLNSAELSSSKDASPQAVKEIPAAYRERSKRTRSRSPRERSRSPKTSRKSSHSRSSALHEAVSSRSRANSPRSHHASPRRRTPTSRSRHTSPRSRGSSPHQKSRHSSLSYSRHRSRSPLPRGSRREEKPCRSPDKYKHHDRHRRSRSRSSHRDHRHSRHYDRSYRSDRGHRDRDRNGRDRNSEDYRREEHRHRDKNSSDRSRERRNGRDHSDEGKRHKDRSRERLHREEKSDKEKSRKRSQSRTKTNDQNGLHENGHHHSRKSAQSTWYTEDKVAKDLFDNEDYELKSKLNHMNKLKKRT